MAIQDTLPHGQKKFLFDLHNFDEGHKEEAEEDLPPPPPPPPTFSEEELAAARAEGRAQGKREGLAEAAASREKHVAALLEKISQDFMILFSAEEDRNAIYEREAVSLAQSIFRQIFPTINRAGGLAEVENMILEVFKSHKGIGQIIIETHPDYVDSINALVESKWNNKAGTGSFAVLGNQSLGPSDCKIAWKDGGALRNADILAEKIHKLLEQTLADRSLLRDNEERNLTGSTPTQMNGDKS